MESSRFPELNPSWRRAFAPRILARADLYAPKVRFAGFSKESVLASVRGTKNYDMRLGVDEQGNADPSAQNTSCTCPHFAEGNRCKHLAAMCMALEARTGFSWVLAEFEEQIGLSMVELFGQGGRPADLSEAEAEMLARTVVEAVESMLAADESHEVGELEPGPDPEEIPQVFEAVFAALFGLSRSGQAIDVSLRLLLHIVESDILDLAILDELCDTCFSGWVSSTLRLAEGRIKPETFLPLSDAVARLWNAEGSPMTLRKLERAQARVLARYGAFAREEKEERGSEIAATALFRLCLAQMRAKPADRFVARLVIPWLEMRLEMMRLLGAPEEVYDDVACEVPRQLEYLEVLARACLERGEYDKAEREVREARMLASTPEKRSELDELLIRILRLEGYWGSLSDELERTLGEYSDPARRWKELRMARRRCAYDVWPDTRDRLLARFGGERLRTFLWCEGKMKEVLESLEAEPHVRFEEFEIYGGSLFMLAPDRTKALARRAGRSLFERGSRHYEAQAAALARLARLGGPGQSAEWCSMIREVALETLESYPHRPSLHRALEQMLEGLPVPQTVIRLSCLWDVRFGHLEWMLDKALELRESGEGKVDVHSWGPDGLKARVDCCEVRIPVNQAGEVDPVRFGCSCSRDDLHSRSEGGPMGPCFGLCEHVACVCLHLDALEAEQANWSSPYGSFGEDEAGRLRAVYRRLQSRALAEGVASRPIEAVLGALELEASRALEGGDAESACATLEAAVSLASSMWTDFGVNLLGAAEEVELVRLASDIWEQALSLEPCLPSGEAEISPNDQQQGPGAAAAVFGCLVRLCRQDDDAVSLGIQARALMMLVERFADRTDYAAAVLEELEAAIGLWMDGPGAGIDEDMVAYLDSWLRNGDYVDIEEDSCAGIGRLVVGALRCKLALGASLDELLEFAGSLQFEVGDHVSSQVDGWLAVRLFDEERPDEAVKLLEVSFLNACRLHEVERELGVEAGVATAAVALMAAYERLERLRDLARVEAEASKLLVKDIACGRVEGPILAKLKRFAEVASRIRGKNGFGNDVSSPPPGA